VEGMTGETVGNEMTNGIILVFMYSIRSKALDPEVYGRVLDLQYSNGNTHLFNVRADGTCFNFDLQF
jgi:hypothetical protein